MRASIYISVLLFALTQLFGAAAFAQQLALVPPADCPPDEPDSVQISWVEPCESGTWLYDTVLGCRMWDWHPDPHDTASWSGACPKGQKEGHGVVQWFEHGQRIDRFEGTYRHNRREGFGRYEWNEADRFEGFYVKGVPQGFGTARIAGEVFSGEWRNGCLRKGSRVVAIGVSRRSCSDLSVQVDRPRADML
jgi:MORN repeat